MKVLRQLVERESNPRSPARPRLEDCFRKLPLATQPSKIAAALLYTLLAGCGQLPPVVSADTSCERFAHISFSDAQIKAVAADWTLWESVADQVVAHNIQYDAHCMEVLKEGK